MTYHITPDDLAAFRRCGRQWDFGARGRRNLVPAGPFRPPGPELAIREALDLYYFPGMWDWSREVTAPLVLQGFERALGRHRGTGTGSPDPGWQQQADEGRGLLTRYFSWAQGADRFSPVIVQAEFEVHVLDPETLAGGLLTTAGEDIRYRGRIDMLAVDASDAYWIVRHSLVRGDWPAVQDLVDDAELVTACWAWEQFYLGMTITGTVHNELRLAPAERRPSASRSRRPGLLRWLGGSRPEQPRPVRQHEPSGGGRSIPQHRRMYAVAREPRAAERISQQGDGQFRRTWVRRGRDEITGAGRRLGRAAAAMTAPGVSTEPDPSPAYCPDCAFQPPCQAMQAGRDPGDLLAGYRRRPDRLEEGRLGGATWGMGRGGAPRRFGA